MIAQTTALEPRIVSFLPSATEMACALGLTENLLAITHCCDYPPEIRDKPLVVHGNLPVENLGFREIDSAVSQSVRKGESLYRVDDELLKELAPTHILTQDLCEVCAPAGGEVSRALEALAVKPQVLWMAPHSLKEIQADIRQLGQATNRVTQAEDLIADGVRRLQAVSQRVARVARRPRIFCAEWIDPLFCAGHWVPEMVEIAGGIDVLGRKWDNSIRITWDAVRAAAPEVIVLMPCGFNTLSLEGNVKWLLERPGWSQLPAVVAGAVFAVDGAYFNRPGPRVVEGTELLAHLMHPERCDWRGPDTAFRHLG